MKIELNQKSGQANVDLNEKDIADALAIADMMETDGWKILKKYEEVLREDLIEEGKRGISVRGRAELSPYKWATLKGYDFRGIVPLAIVERALAFQKEQEKLKHDGQDDGNETD